MPAATAAPPPVVSDETARAVKAAREAAVHLHEARAQRPEVDKQAKTLERITQENGFAAMIREAFGRNA